MKKWIGLLLTAALLCLLPMGAMAYTVTRADGKSVKMHDASICVGSNHNCDYYEMTHDFIEIRKDGLILSGDMGPDLRVRLSENVSDLTLEGVKIDHPGGFIYAQGDNHKTLTFLGANVVHGQQGSGSDLGAIRTDGSLSIIMKDGATLEATGGNGLHGIYAKESLTLSGCGTITAIAVSGAANGIRTDGRLVMKDGVTVYAESKADTTAIYTDDAIEINGATVTAHGYVGIFPGKSISINDSQVEATGDRCGMIINQGQLTVSGSSQVTAYGRDVAAVCSESFDDNNMPIRSVVPIQLSGAYQLTAGQDAASATAVDAYTELHPYLRIALPPATLPQTGDEANIILWCALACVSAMGMAALARRKKAA